MLMMQIYECFKLYFLQESRQYIYSMWSKESCPYFEMGPVYNTDWNDISYIKAYIVHKVGLFNLLALYQGD